MADAADLWRLVRASGVLDENSCYAYLLCCRHFADTSVVAMQQGKAAGFVTAYRPPDQPHTVFVWQVGVASWARRQGIALAMLRHLLASPGCRDVTHLEATVTPSNTPSRRLFESLAEQIAAPLHVQEGFRSDHFASGDHEDEELFQIGPFRKGSCQTKEIT